MNIRPVRAYLVPALLLAGTILLFAQDWQTAANLPGVDMAGLAPAAKNRALHALRAQECSCGCGMKVAECRVKDPKCYYSKGMSSVVIASLKAGNRYLVDIWPKN